MYTVVAVALDAVGLEIITDYLTMDGNVLQCLQMVCPALNTSHPTWMVLSLLVTVVISLVGECYTLIMS